MSKKYYKVIKENFLWEVGAILENKANDGNGYEPIDDVFRKLEDDSEYISDVIIESQPEFFQRVYPVSLATKTVYKLKEQALEALKKEFKD